MTVRCGARSGSGWTGGIRRHLRGSLRLALALASAVLLTAACGEDAPQPGEIQVVVSDGLALGGAVVELSGEGLLGVTGPPGVRVLARPISVQGTKAFPRLRVVAIQETPGPLTLTVQVADRAASLVAATLVEASDGDDRLVPASLLPRIRVLR